MQPTTLDAMRALLKTDPSLSPADRSQIVETIRNRWRPKEPAPKPSIEQRVARVLTRTEVGKQAHRPAAKTNFDAAAAMRHLIEKGRGCQDQDLIERREKRDAKRCIQLFASRSSNETVATTKHAKERDRKSQKRGHPSLGRKFRLRQIDKDSTYGPTTCLTSPCPLSPRFLSPPASATEPTVTNTRATNTIFFMSHAPF